MTRSMIVGGQIKTGDWEIKNADGTITKGTSHKVVFDCVSPNVGKGIFGGRVKNLSCNIEDLPAIFGEDMAKFSGDLEKYCESLCNRQCVLETKSTINSQGRVNEQLVSVYFIDQPVKR